MYVHVPLFLYHPVQRQVTITGASLLQHSFCVSDQKS